MTDLVKWSICVWAAAVNTYSVQGTVNVIVFFFLILCVSTESQKLNFHILIMKL